MAQYLLVRILVYGAALHRAAEKEDTERCHRLIEAGVALDERDDYGMSPMDYATEGRVRCKLCNIDQGCADAEAPAHTIQQAV